MDNGEAQRAEEAKVVARVTPYQLGTLTSESFRVKMLVQHQRTEIIGFVWGPGAVEGTPDRPGNTGGFALLLLEVADLPIPHAQSFFCLQDLNLQALFRKGGYPQDA